MIVPLDHPAQVYPAGTLYVVVVHWTTDGEYGSYEAIFTERTDALHQFHNDLREEFLVGSIPRWKESSQFVEEESDNSYECYLDGEYCENHFSITLEQRALPLSPAFCRSTAELYRAECLRDDFREHIENHDDFQRSLTRRKKHCCVLPICRSGSPTSWSTAAPTVRLTGRRCPMWHALC